MGFLKKKIPGCGYNRENKTYREALTQGFASKFLGINGRPLMRLNKHKDFFQSIKHRGKIIRF